MSGRRVTLLAGGVGGAKMAEGLAGLCAADELTIVGNVADDQEFHGLWVSPDIDTLTYSLAGLIDRQKGWGLAQESSRTLDALQRLGCDTWMYLGDQDFATHIYRTEQRRRGVRPTLIAEAIAQALGVRARIVLPTDDRLQTKVHTSEGWLSFQEYFVRWRCEPEVLDVSFAGQDQARPTPEALKAIRDADLLVIAPSNPIVSIASILALPELRQAFVDAKAYKLAVSPLLGGRPVKGPADRMLLAAGYSCDNFGVAQSYSGLIDALVIDAQDDADADALREQRLNVLVTDTLMSNDSDKKRLADDLLRFTATQRPLFRP